MTSDQDSPPTDDLSIDVQNNNDDDEESSHLPTKRFNKQSERTLHWFRCWKLLSRCAGKRKLPEMLGEMDVESIWTNPRVEGPMSISNYEFEIHEQISDTKSSQIFLVRMIQSGKLAVLKCMNRAPSEESTRNLQTLRVERELGIWRALFSHPNVTNLYATFETSKHFCYLMQYVPFRSLHDLICQGITFDRRSLKKIFAELASVLITMHAVGIIHREITCSNILLSKEFGCLLCDFSSSVVAASSKRRTGSIAYMAPEMIAKHTYTNAADWWSYGIVLYAVNHKSTPLSIYLESTGVDLEQLAEEDRFRLAADVKIRLDPNLAMATKSLLTELLRVKPETRLGVRYSNFELLRNHPFFIGFDWHLLIAAENKIITSPQTKLLLSECADAFVSSGLNESSADSSN